MNRTYDASKLTGAFRAAFEQFGGLTVAQIEALNFERPQVTLNVDHIVSAFKVARANGLKTPKVRVAGFVFKFAPEMSANPGALYVIEADAGFDEYLGKIMNNKFMPVRACTKEQEARILAAAANPLEAIIAFGKQTGKCSICARPLTDPDSVQQGVGPICRAKFGL